MLRCVACLPLVLLAGLVLLGCEPPPTTAGAAVSAPPGPPAPPPPPAPPGAAPAADPPPAEPAMERVKAEAGVGIKGRSLDEYEGVVVTPAKTYFTARERIFFEIEFPGNYRIWRAMEDAAPQDFEDLKARFLDPLGLTAKMPQLPPGHRYVWDAAAEELQVERPKPKAAPPQ